MPADRTMRCSSKWRVTDGGVWACSVRTAAPDHADWGHHALREWVARRRRRWSCSRVRRRHDLGRHVRATRLRALAAQLGSSSASATGRAAANPQAADRRQPCRTAAHGCISRGLCADWRTKPTSLPGAHVPVEGSHVVDLGARGEPSDRAGSAQLTRSVRRGEGRASDAFAGRHGMEHRTTIRRGGTH